MKTAAASKMGTGGGLVVIDFTKQGNSAHFLRDGWSGQEPDRVWAVGPRSRLVVPIPTSGRAIILEAELAPTDPSPIAAGQIVRVRVNGSAIGGIRLNSRTMIRCEIDPAIAGHEGRLDIEFEFPGFYRPNSLGVAGDDRPLSCWFSFARLYTTDMYKPGPWFPASHGDIPVVNLPPPFAEAANGETPATGAVYTFGSSGTATFLPRDGWDVGEDSLSLTAGRSARLELPAPPAPGAYALHLDIRVPAPDMIRMREVSVLLDRIVIGQFGLGQSATCVMALPRELTEGRDRLPLTLVLPDARHPGGPGSPADTPALGIAVSRIAILPLALSEPPFAAGEPAWREASRGALTQDADEGSENEPVRTRATWDDLPVIHDQRFTRLIAPGAVVPATTRASGAATAGGAEIRSPENPVNPVGVDAAPKPQSDESDGSPRDVAQWVRNLSLRAPRDMREVFLLLGRWREGETLEALLDRTDFTDASPARMFEVLIGRPPGHDELSADPADSGAQATFRRTILSREFRERSLFAFLDAFPELAREIFIHVPKCAGTDLIMNLGQRLMPLPYVLKFPDWISDGEFLNVLGGLAQQAPFHDRIFFYGHMFLGDFPAGFRPRPNDKIFSIIRDPLALMVSQANYVIGRLRQDPEGRDPDTAETLEELGMPRLPDGLSVGELKDLAVRVLFNRKIVFTNNACRHLGRLKSKSFEEALGQIAVNDVEITTTEYYDRWLKQRWGIGRSEHHNRSAVLLTVHEARRLYAAALMDSMTEDLKLFSLVTWAIEKAGTPSVTGQQIMRFAAAGFADELIEGARRGLTGEAKGLFVVQNAFAISRYLHEPSP